MTDLTPWAVDLSFADLGASTGFKGVLGGLFGKKAAADGKEGGEAAVGDGVVVGEVFKQAPLYGPNTPMPFKKTLSITRTTDFEVRVDC